MSSYLPEDRHARNGRNNVLNDGFLWLGKITRQWLTCQKFLVCSYTVQANEAMARASLANVASFLQGRIDDLTHVDE
jgi:hypothetical protein